MKCFVAGEKRSALLAEVTRLREERSSESGEAAGKDGHFNSLQPCRGTVSISNIQLPLKVEFVCSSHSKPGTSSRLFFKKLLLSTTVVRSLVYVSPQDGQVTTSLSWSVMARATLWPPRWPRPPTLRMETPSPSPLLSLCRLLISPHWFSLTRCCQRCTLYSGIVCFLYLIFQEGYSLVFWNWRGSLQPGKSLNLTFWFREVIFLALKIRTILATVVPNVWTCQQLHSSFVDLYVVK